MPSAGTDLSCFRLKSSRRRVHLHAPDEDVVSVSFDKFRSKDIALKVFCMVRFLKF